jgi:PAS domain S-box-containing protein
MEMLTETASTEKEYGQIQKALRQQAGQLEALQDISLAMTAQLDLNDLLQEIVEHAVRLLDVKAASLYLVDETRDGLKQVVSHGYEQDYTGTRLASGEGIAGKVYQNGDPMSIDNYSDWEGRAADWEDENLTASLSVPLKYGGRIMGTLGFDEVTEAKRFGEHDIWLATLSANQAAIAIQNARLYEQAQREITERKQAEKTLRETTNQLQAFLDHSPALVSIFDQDGRYQLVNAAVADVLGMTQGEVVGRSFADLLPPNVATTFMAQVERLNETRSPMVVEDWLKVKGEERLFETILFPLSDGGDQPFVYGSISTDVTERKRAERRRRRLTQAVESSIDGIAILDAQQCYTYVNQSHVAIYGYATAEDLLGNTWRMLYDDAEIE